MSKKNKKQELPDKFWWIYNQEEAACGIAYAKTEGGALSKFEVASGETRMGYRAEEISFYRGCGLSNTVQ